MSEENRKRTLASRTDLSGLKPKSTVKVKSRKNAPQQNKPPVTKPKVVQNVSVPEEQIVPPTEEDAKILSRLNDAKIQLVSAMKAFNKLVSDQTLPENKSSKDKYQEQNVINGLVNAAQSVESLSPNEGVLGVCVFAVRQALSLRDAGNKLAYELHQVKNRLAKIEQDIYGEANGKSE